MKDFIELNRNEELELELIELYIKGKVAYSVKDAAEKLPFLKNEGEICKLSDIFIENVLSTGNYGEYTTVNWEPDLEIDPKGDINNLLGKKVDILNECSPVHELYYYVEIVDIYNPEELNEIINQDDFGWNSEEGREVMKNITCEIRYIHIKDITEE